MRNQWMIALLAAIGCVAVFLGAAKVLPKYFGGIMPNEALRDCEKLVQSHFQSVTMPTPTERHDGQYQVFTWANINGQPLNKHDATVKQTATCKFDPQGHRVVYIGFN
jgi:hypothetical protein